MDNRQEEKESLIAQSSLTDVLAANQRDAERYRWLREQHWSESRLCVVEHPKNAVKLGHVCPSLEHLDVAIDEAMKAANASHNRTMEAAHGHQEIHNRPAAEMGPSLCDC